MPSISTPKSFKYTVQQTMQPTLAPLTVAVTGALAAGSLQAATITVDTLADGFFPGQCTLRSALIASSSNVASFGCSSGELGLDTIEFAAGLQGIINLSAGLGDYYDGATLAIGESAVIDGDERITVRGSGAAPVFYAQYYSDFAEDIEFRGLTITGGGGERGGGIVSFAPYVKVENSIITANTASEAGGGIWQGGTAYFIPSLEVIDSVISDNSVTSLSAKGGGIYTNTALVITRSVITGNVAAGDGGGIHHFSDFVLRTQGSTFERNEAINRGGAIYLRTLEPLSATFVSEGDLFAENYARSYGGGVSIGAYIQSESVNELSGGIRIYGSTFEENATSSFGDGGGLRIRRVVRDGSSDYLGSPIRIGASSTYASPTTFIGNYAERGGGLFFDTGDSIQAQISDTYFIDNVGIDAGGGASIFARDGGASLEHSVFSGNVASGSYGSGGGLYLSISEGGRLTASNLIVHDNHTQRQGGGFLLRAFNASFDLDRLIVSGNTAESGGGLILSTFSLTGSDVSVSNSEFSNNQATEFGGGASFQFNSLASLALTNSTLSGNQAGSGAGLHVAGEAAFNLKYSTIADNIADTEGGGLLTDLDGTCNVRASLFDLNSATSSSAQQDVRIEGGSDLCTIRNTLLAGNASELNDGGGNIIGQPSLIEALADNGGTGGKTHALPGNSPAIDAAGTSSQSAPLRDQRGFGFPREFGDEVDMGAFEFNTIIDEIFSDRFENL